MTGINKSGKKMTNNEKVHPWSRFLNARYDAIIWMKEEFGYTDKTIAIKLSMDEQQVYLIRTSEHMPIPEPKYEP